MLIMKHRVVARLRLVHRVATLTEQAQCLAGAVDGLVVGEERAKLAIVREVLPEDLVVAGAEGPEQCFGNELQGNRLRELNLNGSARKCYRASASLRKRALAWLEAPRQPAA